MPRQEGNALLYCMVEQTGSFAAMLPFLGYSSRMCAGAASPQRHARPCNVYLLDTDDNMVKNLSSNRGCVTLAAAHCHKVFP